MGQFNENIKLVAPNPLDSRYLSTRLVAGAQQPYSATTEVNTVIDSLFRYVGLTVLINGVETSGENKEYWYKTGITNTSLVEKEAGGAGTITGGTNGLSADGADIVLGGTLTSVSGTTIDADNLDLSIINVNDFQISTSGNTNLIGVDTTGILLSYSGVSATTSVSLEGNAGLTYEDNYRTGFTEYSLPDVGYVTGLTGTYLKLDQTNPQDVCYGQPFFHEGLVIHEFPTPALITGHTVGRMFYDPVYETITAQIGHPDTCGNAVNLQLGQEMLRLVYNATSCDILNGDVVRTVGTHCGLGSCADVPAVCLAKASDMVCGNVVGIATQVISATTSGGTGYGFITTQGYVSDIDTTSGKYTGFTAGDIIYLSPTVEGGVTNVPPVSPNIQYRLGRLTTTGTTGKLNVDLEILYRLDDLADVNASTPTLDDVLKWNGLDWVNGVVGSSSASAGINFYYATPIINAVTPPAGISEDGTSGNGIQVATLSRLPVTSGATLIVAGLSASDNRAFAAWEQDFALNRTTIDAGLWEFYDSLYVSNNLNDTYLMHGMYQIVPMTGGTITTTSGTTNSYTATTTGNQFAGTYFNASATNTEASYLQTPTGVYQISSFIDDNNVVIAVPNSYPSSGETAVSGSTWNNLFTGITETIEQETTPILYQTKVVANSFTISKTDKLGHMLFVSSSNAYSLTLSYNGPSDASFFISPLVTLHNELAGLQGGSGDERYHNTCAESQLLTGINDYSVTAKEVCSLVGVPVTLTGTELGYVDGVTSSIQTQLNNKLNTTIFTGYTATTSPVITNAITGATNLGTGTTVYSGTTGRSLNFSTIVGSGGTTVQKVGDEIIIESTAPSGSTYNLASPSVCATGGMCIGTTLTGKTAFEILQEILVPELFGTLTLPSFSTTLNPSATYYEIGCTIGSLDVCGTFGRGCIDPQYDSADDKRVGYANQYVYTGPQIDGTYPSSACTISQNVSGYVVSGTPETWGITVDYDAGVQPYGNNGTAFDSACPASTLVNSKTICGVFPLFATTSAIGSLTKQGLQSMNTSPVTIVLVAEDGFNKQKFEIPDLWYTAKPLLCVCTYNTFSSNWEFEGGSGAASLFTWTPTTGCTETTCCGSTPYCLFTYAGANRLTTTSIRLVF